MCSNDSNLWPRGGQVYHVYNRFKKNKNKRFAKTTRIIEKMGYKIALFHHS